MATTRSAKPGKPGPAVRVEERAVDKKNARLLKGAYSAARNEVGLPALPPSAEDVSFARIAREQRRLEKRQRLERAHRIRTWKAAYRHVAQQTTVRGAGPPPLRILAEGDSWFELPFKQEIVEWLERRLGVPICNLAHHGDEARQILGVHQRKDLENTLRRDGPFDALLFSGGGNDVVGDPLCLLVKPRQEGLPPEHHVDPIRFAAMLALLRAAYEDLIAIRDAVSPSTWLFFNGYDFPIPDGTPYCRGVGPWLIDSLQYRGFTALSERVRIMRAMLEGMAAVWSALATPRCRIAFVGTQGTLRGKDDWHDELHPSDDGFPKIAAKFHAALRDAFPGRVR